MQAAAVSVLLIERLEPQFGRHAEHLALTEADALLRALTRLVGLLPKLHQRVLMRQLCSASEVCNRAAAEGSRAGSPEPLQTREAHGSCRQLNCRRASAEQLCCQRSAEQLCSR
jgi:hypothetical protein